MIILLLIKWNRLLFSVNNILFLF